MDRLKKDFMEMVRIRRKFTVMILTLVFGVIVSACAAASSAVIPEQREQATSPTVSPASTLVKTVEPAPTATLTPEAGPQVAGKNNCDAQDQTIRKEIYDILGFGSSACKFQQISPDGEFEVVVRLESPGREVLMLESKVETKEIDWRNIAEEIGCGKCTLRDVQWGDGQTLVVSIAATTSGPSVVSVMNVNGVELARLPGYFGNWNESHTSFYTVLENHWIYDAFGVYDFSTGKSFALDKLNGVKVSGWVGNQIFVTITPYEADGAKYCTLPAYAAKMEMTPDGPIWNIIKSSPGMNIKVDETGNIMEEPYQRTCDELIG